eukprot:m.116614 g.116614  ORF g.116614 m.116614 type:complete len:104 (-) comp14471_c0_seq2:92-403(-)
MSLSFHLVQLLLNAHQVSAALRALVSTQTWTLSTATQAQADRISTLSTSVQTTLNDLSTRVSTRIAMDLDRSTAIVALSQSASNAVAQVCFGLEPICANDDSV